MSELSAAQKDIITRMGLDPRAVVGNLKDFYHRIGGMESDNRLDAANNISSAKGVYQYLNGNGDEQGRGSSFDVALNRLERAYKRANADTPEWVSKARGHMDPRKLSREQSDDLMLADMVYGPHPVSKDIATYLQRGQVDPSALHRVYSHHHTDITNTAEQGDVLGRMNKWLGKATQ